MKSTPKRAFFNGPIAARSAGSMTKGDGKAASVCKKCQVFQAHVPVLSGDPGRGLCLQCLAGGRQTLKKEILDYLEGLTHYFDALEGPFSDHKREAQELINKVKLT